MAFFSQPTENERLGEFLKTELSNNWDRFRAAVAFVKRSGTKHIVNELASFAQTSSVEIIAGIDHQGSSAEGLRDLLQSVQHNGRVLVLHNRLPFTFHPKLFVFSSSTNASVILGSGNLTEGGLYTNYEAGLRLELDFEDSEHLALYEEINSTLDQWADTSSGITLELDEPLLSQLSALGLVPSEAVAKVVSPEESEDSSSGATAFGDAVEEVETSKIVPFAALAVPKAPKSPKVSEISRKKRSSPDIATNSNGSETLTDVNGFVMTLQTTDVGVGQVTTGTSRRSPEVFIPLGARDMYPDFWGWPTNFKADANWSGPIDGHGFGKMDRMNVPVRLGGENTTINMWYNPDKRDLRLRSEALRSAGNVGDILRIERVSGAEYDYYIEVVPSGTTQFPVYITKCVNSVRPPSKKKYGYY